MHRHELFIANAENIIAESNRKGTYLLFYFDITNFESVNQIYGLRAGDRLLQEVEEELNAFPDVVLCDRIFSDHFLSLAIFDDPISPKTIMNEYRERARTFLGRQEKYFPNCRLKVSCGICPVEDGDILTAMDEANVARKESKKQGSSHAVWFDRSMQEYLEKRYEKEKEINLAMRERRLCFYLQPKVNIKTGEILGAEALVRGIARNGQIVGPGYFLPIMESEGSIIDLDFMVCEQVCEHMALRREKKLPIVCTSVNLSRLHLYEEDTAERLHEIVSSYDIPPEYIEFELTENIFLREFDSAKRLLNRLRGYGYKVSIDDFGSGYSGINIWQEMDFDVLKLDRSFLDEDEEHRQRNEALLPNLVDISNRLNITVLCEGVETKSQCRYLLKIGCNIAQGFLFSKPVPADDFYDHYETSGGKYPSVVDSPSDKKENQDDKTEPESINIGVVFKNKQALFSIICGLCLLVLFVTVIFFQYRHFADGSFSVMAERLLTSFTTGQESSSAVDMDDVIFILEDYSQSMVIHSLVATGMVVLAVVLFAILFVWLFVRTQRELEYEKKQYELLAEFYDTVLFQYDIKRDKIRFSPNAKEIFRLRDLQQKDFIKNLSEKYIFPADRDILMGAL
ncbi:MAG: GGDEF domain-containing protein [Bacillota bacterium]|nr:GGDEF domain-containing protein [Bacillota bacterium]